jgi:hypothetical protein
MNNPKNQTKKKKKRKEKKKQTTHGRNNEAFGGGGGGGGVGVDDGRVCECTIKDSTMRFVQWTRCWCDVV